MGGPRKGYGAICMEQFEKELQAIQLVDFEFLYLKDYHLESCIGCCNCFFRGEDKCPFAKKDDRDLIFTKMDEADGIIFMAPIYSLHVPALMKNFFDRFAYIFHRPYFFGKIAMGICNQGIAQGKKVTSYFNEVAESWGFNYVHSVVFPTIPTGGVEEKMLKRMRKACRIFLNALKGERYQKPKLGGVIGFKIRKVLHSIAVDETNADYVYWRDQGWLEDDSKYYYETKIGLGKRILAGLLKLIVKPKLEQLFTEDPKEMYDQYMKLQAINFNK